MAELVELLGEQAVRVGRRGLEARLPDHLVATGPQECHGGDDDDGDEDGEGDPDRGQLGLVIRVANRPAEQGEADSPDQATECVGRQEPAIGHLGGTGESWHDGSEEGNKASQEDRGGPSAVDHAKPAIDVRPVMSERLGREDLVTEPLADPVAGGVACDGGHHDDRADRHQVHVVPTGEHPADDDRCLTGDDEAQEEGCLGKD